MRFVLLHIYLDVKDHLPCHILEIAYSHCTCALVDFLNNFKKTLNFVLLVALDVYFS